MIQALAGLVGVGAETAATLVHEVFSRRFRDRRALAAFVGMTGTPYDSGGSKREQGPLQERQSPGAPHPHPIDAALDDVSAAERARPMVHGSRRRRQGPDEEDHGRRPGAQAFGRPAALRRDRPSEGVRLTAA